MKKALFPLLAALGIAGAVYYIYYRPPTALVLTGIVTTNDVVVSPQIAGQIRQLLIVEGDQVKKDQLLAVITPDELKAESAYYAQNAAGLTSQVQESEAALRYQQLQTTDQIRQAESTLPASKCQFDRRPATPKTRGRPTARPRTRRKEASSRPRS